jgi:predicted dehydrogenase
MTALRLGLVGVNTYHAQAFSRILNGSDDEAQVIHDARIVTAWGGADHQEATAELAAKYRIETTVMHPEQMLGAVDGVLIVDDTGGGASHASLARPFLEAGLPVFVDKPMTTEYADAVSLFDLADKTGAPLLSCSALRFTAEVAAADKQLAAVGKLSSVVSVGTGDWFYYGVHGVELLGAVAGTGATWVHRHVFDDRDLVVIGYDGGPSAVVETLRDAAYTFHVTAYGSDGWTSVEVTDWLAFYSNTMRAFVTTARTGRSPLTRQQTLEVLAVLHAGNLSAERGDRVLLSEVTGG